MRSHADPIRRWLPAVAAAIVLAAATVAGCGDDDDDGATGGADATAPATTEAPGGATTDTGGGAATRLAVIAEEANGLRWSRSAYTAQAGEVTIALDNPNDNALPHAVEVEGEGVDEETETIEPGQTAEVTVSLSPGRYVVYCPVDEHRAQGMESTLTVH